MIYHTLLLHGYTGQNSIAFNRTAARAFPLLEGTPKKTS